MGKKKEKTKGIAYRWGSLRRYITGVAVCCLLLGLLVPSQMVLRAEEYEEETRQEPDDVRTEYADGEANIVYEDDVDAGARTEYGESDEVFTESGEENASLIYEDTEEPTNDGGSGDAGEAHIEPSNGDTDGDKALSHTDIKEDTNEPERLEAEDGRLRTGIKRADVEDYEEGFPYILWVENISDASVMDIAIESENGISLSYSYMEEMPDRDGEPVEKTVYSSDAEDGRLYFAKELEAGEKADVLLYVSYISEGEDVSYEDTVISTEYADQKKELRMTIPAEYIEKIARQQEAKRQEEAVEGEKTSTGEAQDEKSDGADNKSVKDAVKTESEDSGVHLDDAENEKVTETDVSKEKAADTPKPAELPNGIGTVIREQNLDGDNADRIEDESEKPEPNGQTDGKTDTDEPEAKGKQAAIGDNVESETQISADNEAEQDEPENENTDADFIEPETIYAEEPRPEPGEEVNVVTPVEEQDGQPEDLIQVTLPTHFVIPMIDTGNGIEVRGEDVTIANNSGFDVEVAVKSVTVSVKRGDEMGIRTVSLVPDDLTTYDLRDGEKKCDIAMHIVNADGSENAYATPEGTTNDIASFTLDGSGEGKTLRFEGEATKGRFGGWNDGDLVVYVEFTFDRADKQDVKSTDPQKKGITVTDTESADVPKSDVKESTQQ